MKINSLRNFSPNFGAQYVCDMPVKQKSGADKEFSVVLLDVQDRQDLRALRRISRSWHREHKKYNYGYNYTSEIYKDAKEEKLRQQLYRYTDLSQKYIAVTSQKGKFEKLDPKQIVAVTHLCDANDERAYIQYLQVRPKYKFNGSEEREISHIGKTFIKTLNGIMCKSSFLFADEYSSGFYRKICAEVDDESPNTFVLEF